MATVEIVSFGYLHADAPEADVVLDLRRAFRDPHIDPAIRQLTGRDPLVQRAVLRTPGVRRLLKATVRQIAAYAEGPSDRIVIGSGCAGGRHRSVVVADQLARRLRRRGHTVTVTHRDLHQPVVQR